jgi:hypothetical protein
MTTKEQHLAEIERQIKDSQEDLEMGKALQRLKMNPDFKRLILEGYLTEEAVRLVHLKANPSMAAPDKQVATIRDIDAIGSFYQFLHVVGFKGRQAETSIEQAEQARQEIQEEDE